jgi:hypothetical protein
MEFEIDTQGSNYYHIGLDNDRPGSRMRDFGTLGTTPMP